MSLSNEHEGEMLRDLLKELGIKYKALAFKIEKNQNTITRWCKEKKLKSDVLIEIGKAIHYDMTQAFPRLKNIPEARALNYFNEDPEELLSVVEDFKMEYGNKKLISEYEREISHLNAQIETMQNLINDKSRIIDMQFDEIQNYKSQLKATK